MNIQRKKNIRKERIKGRGWTKMAKKKLEKKVLGAK